jgi:hypothetical protein
VFQQPRSSDGHAFAPSLWLEHCTAVKRVCASPLCNSKPSSSIPSAMLQCF